MSREAVFYFDVLGFREQSGGTATKAIISLTDLSELVETTGIFDFKEEWHHRYALSDSVFLTHSDPLVALRLAGELVFRLVKFNAEADHVVLVRGGLALGEVQHLHGIFTPQVPEPANVVGEGVVQAVSLESKGLKGPRILLSEDLVEQIRDQDPEIARWWLRPTAVTGVWEILWLLPWDPESLERWKLEMPFVFRLSRKLLRSHRERKESGPHARALALLAARCVERIYRRSETLIPPAHLAELYPPEEIFEILDTTSGIPATERLELAQVAETVARIAGIR